MDNNKKRTRSSYNTRPPLPQRKKGSSKVTSNKTTAPPLPTTSSPATEPSTEEIPTSSQMPQGLLKLWSEQLQITNERKQMDPNTIPTSELKLFPFPLCFIKHYTVEDYQREADLRTGFAGFRDMWFENHLAKARFFKLNPLPNYINWDLIYDGNSVVLPDSIKESIAAFNAIEFPTSDEIQMVIDFSRSLQMFVQILIGQAISNLIAKQSLVSADALSKSYFDNLDETVKYYSSGTNELKLPDMQKFFSNLFPAIQESLASGIPGPVFPDFRNRVQLNTSSSENQTAGIVVDEDMIRNTPNTTCMYEFEKGIWKKFLGTNLAAKVVNARGWTLTMNDLLGFRRNAFLNDKVMNCLVNLIIDDAIKNGNRHFCSFLLYLNDNVDYDSRALLDDGQFKDVWDAINTASEAKKDEKFRIFFQIRVRGENKEEEQMCNFLLIIASFQGEGNHCIEFYDPAFPVNTATLPEEENRTVQEVEGDEHSCEQIVGALKIVKTFMQGLMAFKGKTWEFNQDFKSQKYLVPHSAFRLQKTHFDSGVWVLLCLERYLQGINTFKNTHCISCLEKRSIDRQKIDYLFRIIDRYEGSLNPEMRQFWESPKEPVVQE